jgi:hypothetical protein
VPSVGAIHFYPEYVIGIGAAGAAPEIIRWWNSWSCKPISLEFFLVFHAFELLERN